MGTKATELRRRSLLGAGLAAPAWFGHLVRAGGTGCSWRFFTAAEAEARCDLRSN